MSPSPEKEEAVKPWPVLYGERGVDWWSTIQPVVSLHPEGQVKGRETQTYYPADHPAVLTPDEAAQIAHHLPPNGELWKRLFNWAADEGGH